MRKLAIGTIMAAATLLGMATAGAAGGMRCGGYLVSPGDSQTRVLEVCGEPQRAWQDGFIEETERRNQGYYDPSMPPPYPNAPGGYEREIRRVIPVYKSEYNQGRGTFLKTLVFHGDILVEIIVGARQ